VAFTTRLVEMRNSDPADDRQGRLIIARQGGEAACLVAHNLDSCAGEDNHWISIPWPNPRRSRGSTGNHLSRGNRRDGRTDFIEPRPSLLPHDLDLSSCSQGPEEVTGAPVSYANV